MGPILEWRRASGQTVVVGDYRVTPQCRALTVRLPFGVLAWNRPVAVVVERDGRVRRLRILDVTRLAQLVIFGAALGLWLLARRAPTPQKEHAA